jgi:hypothetical protein
MQHYFLRKWHTTDGGVASVGARVTFSSPDENARAGETAPKSQYQPTLATPLVGKRFYLFNIFSPFLLIISDLHLLII